MKTLVIEKESPWSVYATLMIKSMVRSEGDVVDVVHVKSVGEATALVSDEEQMADYYVVVILGLALSSSRDVALISKIDELYDQPFTEVIWANSYGDVPESDNIEYVGAQSDAESVIMNLYRTLQSSTFFASRSPVEDVVRGVHDYYTGKSIGSENIVGSALVGLYEVFGTYAEELLVNMTVPTLIQNNIEIVKHHLEKQSKYVTSKANHARVTRAEIIGIPVTVAVVSAEQFKNEVAERLMSTASTDAVIVIIMEEFTSDSLFTIRTRNFDALRVAKLIQPTAGGKFSSASAWGNVVTATDTLGDMLVKFLSEN